MLWQHLDSLLVVMNARATALYEYDIEGERQEKYRTVVDVEEGLQFFFLHHGCI